NGRLCWQRESWPGWQSALPIKFEPERPAEGGKGPFGGVSFCRLECDVVNLAGRCPAAFARAMSFPDHRCAIRVHGNPHLGHIDCDKGAAIFTGEYATGLDGLAAPAIEPEDPICFRDCEPALNVGELAPMGLAGADLPAIEISAQRLQLLC